MSSRALGVQICTDCSAETQMVGNQIVAKASPRQTIIHEFQTHVILTLCLLGSRVSGCSHGVMLTHTELIPAVSELLIRTVLSWENERSPI